MSTPGEAKAKEKPQTAGQLLIRSLVQRGGVVSLADTLKQTHYSIDSVAIMKPVTEFSVAVNAPDAAGEAVANAFRAAMTPRAGASFIALPGGRAGCGDGKPTYHRAFQTTIIEPGETAAAKLRKGEVR